MISKEAQRVREFIRNNSTPNQTLDEARRNFKDMKTIIKFPEKIEKIKLSADNVNCELFVPKEVHEDKIIIYFHGGGYCLGISDNNRNFAAKIAYESGYKTLLVDYRLAPENKYPSAREDALSVYMWLINNNYKSENIIFMGESSGCGLILSALFKAREIGMLMPAALIFISPVVDYTKSAKSLITKKELDPYRYNDPFSIANNFLEGNDVNDQFISPIYGDLSGLPSMLIHAGEYDVFLDNSINLAEKAKKQGVNVTIKIWEELWHVFHVSADIVPEGKEALREIYKFINENF